MIRSPCPPDMAADVRGTSAPDHCRSFAFLFLSSEEGQAFDRLRPNGVSALGRQTLEGQAGAAAALAAAALARWVSVRWARAAIASQASAARMQRSRTLSSEALSASARASAARV